jgi:hypothetical protein
MIEKLCGSPYTNGFRIIFGHQCNRPQKSRTITHSTENTFPVTIFTKRDIPSQGKAQVMAITDALSRQYIQTRKSGCLQHS